MSKHTPAPWVLVNTGRVASHRHVMTEGGCAIANICDRGVLDSEECEANANLIAAAPKLLEALKQVLQSLQFAHSAYPEIDGKVKAYEDMSRAREAIAEAEGG